ncbi:MAG: AAA family ATPase [Clostridiales bacterium]|nr:AAA family ATPase [Clostridiales bacterium]
MIIRRIAIRNFGKLHDRTIELAPGMNVLYGENESGKSTFHTFVRSMLYGVRRQRGRAAKNDTYSAFEPWEDPTSFGGTLWLEYGGKNYRITRNFYKEKQQGEVLCEDNGEVRKVNGAADAIFENVSEAVYDNTVSVAQLKSVTGKELVDELRNYMAGYQGAGDCTVDLGRAMQILKMTRKGFLAQEERRKREAEAEQEKVSSNIEFVQKEIRDLEEKKAQIEKKERSLQARTGDSIKEGDSLLDQGIREIREKMLLSEAGVFAALLLGILGIVFLPGIYGSVWVGVSVGAVAAAVAAGAVFLRLRLARELRIRERHKTRLVSAGEELKGKKEEISGALEEKRMALDNLKEDFLECEGEKSRITPEQGEIQALNLAMDRIESLSGSFSRQVGGRLRQRTSAILCEITGGKYREILMDEDFQMWVNTDLKTVPVERLSRGTLEQIYFALRMSAGELLCGKEKYPVILDDVFGMYDEERLSAVLHWLAKENRQVILCTCHEREMEILEREGIDFHKVSM